MNANTRELRIHSACLMVVAALAVCLALYWLRSVLVPFVLALFFAVGLVPILDVIERRLRAPRLVAVAITFVAGLVLMAVLWSFIALSVKSLVEESGDYKDRMIDLAKSVEKSTGIQLFSDPAQIKAKASGDDKSAGTPVDDASQPATDEVGDANASGGDDTQGEPTPSSSEQGKKSTPRKDAANSGDKLQADIDGGETAPPKLQIPNLGTYVSHWMSLISAALLDISSNAVMVLIFMFFMLLGGSTSVIPRGGVWMEIEGKIRGYIVTKTIISIFTGLAFGLVLSMFGVPLALVFGLLAFLLNFIPNIGPVIASLLPLPLILLHPELALWQMILVIVLSSGVQIVSGNIIEPKVMGDSFELHPIAILLTLMFWGVIWGIVGMFLAVPMTAAVNILLARFERTKPIADILAGRFDALTELLGDKAEKPPAA